MNRQPISRDNAAEWIAAAEEAFDGCWSTLSALKLGGTERDPKRFVEFQPCLAQAVHDLDRHYDAIRAEERNLISIKSSLEPQRFRDRMAELAHFRKALDKTTQIGWALGDAFAWIFYRGSPEMLPRQVVRPRVGRTPPGLGGKGELAFVRAFPRFKHYFPLYHGVTSFLRSGDFSLVDLRTFKVAALIELKTSRINPNTLSFSINVVGSQRLDDLVDGFTVQSSDMDSKPKPPSIPGFEAHLQSQIRTMGSVVKETQPGDRAELRNAYHVEELRALSKTPAGTTSSYQQVGPGLMILAADMPAARLSERLLKVEGQFDVAGTFPDLVMHVRKLMRPESAYNRLVVSEFSLALMPGGTPLFWWPVDLSFLRKIFFRDAWIGTIFNPAHFAEKLVARGFTVSTKGRPERWSVQKTVGSYRAKLEGLRYFLSAIQYHLMREDAAIDAIDRTLEIAQARPNTRVNMEINHLMF